MRTAFQLTLIMMVTLVLPQRAPSAEHSRDLVRIYTTSPLTTAIARNFDVIHSRPGAYVEVLVGEKDRDALRTLGLPYEIITHDIGRVQAERNRAVLSARPTLGYGSMGGFYTFQEAVAVIDSLHDSDPYGIISALDTLAMTDHGHPIVSFRVSDNAGTDEDEPEVLYNGVHHAREPMGFMNLICYVEYLLGQYNANPEVTYLVDDREMYFIPFVNPDGYAINESIYFNYGDFGYWRKNARDNNLNGFIDDGDGVDLNRNYGYMWGYDDIGSSPDPGSEVYRGPGPFSEMETGTIRAFTWYHEFALALNYHSSGDLMIYPWGYIDQESPDSLYYRELGENITAANNYQYGTDMETVAYMTNGNSDDWMYGEQGEKPKIFSMTPEVGNSYDGFYPEPGRILPLAEENLQGNLYLARVAGAYLMIDDEPSLSDTLGNGNGYPDPGETVEIFLSVGNHGLTESLANVSATLGSSNPLIDWLHTTSSFGTIAPLEIGDNSADPFRIAFHDSIPPGERVRFYLDFSADGGYVSRDSLEVIVGTPVIVFSDDAEGGMGNFQTTRWGIDSRYSTSGNASFSDSPSGNYDSQSSSWMALNLTPNSGLDLSGTGRAYMTYMARWFIEKDWDIAKVQVSRNGSSWETLDGTNTFPGSGFESYHDVDEEGYHSNQLFFKSETVDLSGYTGPGNENVRFRFILYSDSWAEFDGIYIDDIEVSFYPEGGTGIGDKGSASPSLPRALALSQNYPNPFNPLTTIEVAIPEGVNEKVSLRIYDLRGRLVRTLVDEAIPAGRHHFVWDGRTERGETVSSGVYLYTLRHGSRALTRKMTVVR